ncbi:hypothetical protein GCK72_025769 [Caenorhabditis remanei]|uniref:Uncharacterized protein n=2 Tax=Caenorhabditis remanei TaxID=31234 RepID=E3ME37_CAERE|nr:hypothetical protein GCK72_025769 [Caenorhabditis remanei]EFO99518.1 hypothetical protein CRE_22423 [Caenorhabditis remanei]KAF1749302.1 hypothetical protein GCK72_025769 [Caenorhabditis remanei]
MPLERASTPLPTRSKMDRRIERLEKAKAFVGQILDEITNTKGAYKFISFLSVTFMILYMLIVEPESYQIKALKSDATGMVCLVELALGSTCVSAVYGIVHRRALFLAPLLFLQNVVIIYSFSYYWYPYIAFQDRYAVESLKYAEKIGEAIVIHGVLIFNVLLRSSPLLFMMFFMFLTVKTIYCIMFIQHAKNQYYLPSYNAAVGNNSHVWSSIRRKISARQLLDNSTQTPGNRTLPDPDLICEMSAKFRNAKYPHPNEQTPEGQEMC